MGSASEGGCADLDTLFAAEAMHHFPELRAKRALLFCASVDLLQGICRDEKAPHILYMCPQTCNNCSWQGEDPNCPVMASLDEKWCMSSANVDAETAEACREHCCGDPTCTFWQFHSDNGCALGKAVTSPVCKEKLGSKGELIYRQWFSLPEMSFWTYEPYWEDSKEAIARIRSLLERDGWHPCSTCIHSIVQLPNGSQLTPEAARLSLQTNLAYAQHFLRLTGQAPEHPFGQHIRVDLPFPSFSSHAESLFRTLQAEFSSALGNDCCDVVIFDLNRDQVEMIDALYSKMWRAVLGTSAVVVSIVGIAFRAAVIPARLLFTMVFTLSTSFAAAVVLFQFSAGQPGLYWMVPMCASPIIIGLTLDYDLFLLMRVAQYRESGFSTADAVVRGSKKTGETITLAGVIMAAAFSSMLWSNFRVINQFGFLLVASSLIDAFLVRGLLVPAIMLAMDSESNWWPRRMPPVRRKADDLSEDEHGASSLEMTGVESHYLDMSTDVEDTG